ncbi:hypothetical protein PAHAL_4G276100 [Panicum hallii]|uniref:F-box domain-containing protein n=1 Tax=Panicum hallii TaxID=206008 RepID=A0A2S3HLR7_9POAL|nr:MEIOTIC F-BOX protein MOF-like [Panicum hallii]PAN25767.2 hypothetical protein PAHAL_4G276100 [Panicum hallii]
MHCDGVMDFDGEKRSSAPAGGAGSVGGGEGYDYLSSLPDELLLHILLRLPVAAAARTSTLSRRWRELFADIHVVFLALPAARSRARIWGHPRRRRGHRPCIFPNPPRRPRPGRRGYLTIGR